MPEQGITIRELAELVKANTVSISSLAHTVDNLTQKVDGLATTVGELSTTVNNLSTTVDELARMTKDGFDSVTTQLHKIEDRLERIEVIYIMDHKMRIERLEDQVKELMTAR